MTVALLGRTPTAMPAPSKRLPLELDPAVHEYLMDAKAGDGISAADRVRALLSLLREDPELAQRTHDRARQMARERRREDT